MNSKLHNTIFLLILAVSVVLIVLMQKSALILGYFAIIPYLLVFLCVWLLLSVNMLKTAIKNLYIIPTDKRAETFGSLLKKTFFAEWFVKRQELVDVYRHVIELRQVNYETKVKLYQVYENKSIYVPYPAAPEKRRKNKR